MSSGQIILLLVVFDLLCRIITIVHIIINILPGAEDTLKLSLDDTHTTKALLLVHPCSMYIMHVAVLFSYL